MGIHAPDVVMERPLNSVTQDAGDDHSYSSGEFVSAVCLVLRRKGRIYRYSQQSVEGLDIVGRA